MEVAVARFAEKGYEGASLNDILSAAGLGKSSYYYYFADKEDLFVTVLEDFWTRIEAEIPRFTLESIGHLDATTFWPTIEATLAGFAATAARYPELIALARDIRVFWRNPTPRIRPVIDKVVVLQRALLEIGRAVGTVRTDIDVDWLLSITEAADQAVDERLLSRGPPSPDDLREHARVVVDTFRRLVEPAR
jgi:AcrR family transcriptional regulator